MKKLKVLLVVLSVLFIGLFGVFKPKLDAKASPYVYDTHFLEYIQISGEDEFYIYGAYINSFPYTAKQAILNYMDYQHLDCLLINTSNVVFQVQDETYLNTVFPYLYVNSTTRNVEYLDSAFNVVYIQPVSMFFDVELPSDFDRDYYKGYNNGFNAGYQSGFQNGAFKYGYYDDVNNKIYSADEYNDLVYDNIWDDGFTYGYDLGFDTGYNEGKFDGLNENDLNFKIMNFLPGILGVIFMFFFQITSIEFMGISLLQVLSVVLSVAAVYLLIKFFLK